MSDRQRETGMKGLFVVMDIDLDLGLDIDQLLYIDNYIVDVLIVDGFNIDMDYMVVVYIVDYGMWNVVIWRI